MRGKVPFGTMLRAARLGYYYVERLDCFMRASDRGDDFYTELIPNDVRLMRGPTGEPFRVLDATDALMMSSPVLARVEIVTEPMSFLLDEAGEEVT